MKIINHGVARRNTVNNSAALRQSPRGGSSFFSAGMEAGCNGFISFLRSKKLTVQNRHGGRFWAAQGIEAVSFFAEGKKDTSG
jgi:hypothetical protein